MKELLQKIEQEMELWFPNKIYSTYQLKEKLCCKENI